MDDPDPLMWVYPKTCVRHVQKEKEQNYGVSRMCLITNRGFELDITLYLNYFNGWDWRCGPFHRKEKENGCCWLWESFSLFLIESSSKTSFSLAFIDCLVFIQSNGTILLCNAKKREWCSAVTSIMKDVCPPFQI